MYTPYIHQLFPLPFTSLPSPPLSLDSIPLLLRFRYRPSYLMSKKESDFWVMYFLGKNPDKHFRLRGQRVHLSQKKYFFFSPPSPSLSFLLCVCVWVWCVLVFVYVSAANCHWIVHLIGIIMSDRRRCLSVCYAKLLHEIQCVSWTYLATLHCRKPDAVQFCSQEKKKTMKRKR